MTHTAPAFIECIYNHYSTRLRDGKLPDHMRAFFQQKQKILATRYRISLLSLNQKIICKLLNIIKMNNPHFTEVCQQIHTDHIRHMADIIEKRIETGQACFIHSNEHRLALKDADGVVLVWLKISA